MNFPNSIGRRAHITRMAGALAGLALTGASLEAADYSGHVSDDGVNLPYVDMYYAWVGPFGATGSGSFLTTAAGSGNNWFSGGWGLGTTIRYGPYQYGYTFTPTYVDVYTGIFGTESRSDVHFERISYAISGTVYERGARASGVTISLSGATGRSTTTAANGTFSFAQLPTGTFYIIPSQRGYLFVPASRTTSLAPSQAGQDFTRLSALVTTLAASGVAFGDAVLNGTVRGEGTLTNRVWFEYGAGGAFDRQTPVQNLAAGPALVPVNAPLQDLAAGVIYQYRLVAANVNGTNYGQNVEFTMPYPGALTAASLDGIDDYAGVPSAVIPTNGNFTVECWARLPVTAGGTYEILSQGTSGNAFYIGISGANLRLGDTWIAPGVPFPVGGGWHHFAVVKTNNNTFFYLDGEPKATKGSAISNPAPTEFRIGRQYTNFSEYWPGAVDELRVWNVARSATAIQANYQRHLPGSEPGLVAYFQFNALDGASLPNSVPNALPATLRNGAVLANSGALVRNPAASTLTPSPVLATRATLRASVNPAETATVAYFEYGETIAYGSSTAGQDIGAGLKYLPVSTVVTDLQPGTTYHYRSVAFNQFGTTYGEDQTFTTLVLGVG
ncbi:MAG TPA: LamG-like jellyroll fold domain-containing protein, partial [Verrucomicrobiae bacterium]